MKKKRKYALRAKKNIKNIVFLSFSHRKTVILHLKYELFIYK